MVVKFAELGQILVKRFFLGWYTVDRKIDALLLDVEEIKRDLEGVLEGRCDDCPSRMRRG
jgi:hypothetical protein